MLVRAGQRSAGMLGGRASNNTSGHAAPCVQAPLSSSSHAPHAHAPAQPDSGLSPVRVLVYNGPGAGARSALGASLALQQALKPVAVEVDFVNTEALLNGSWRDGCALLVMPGGADLPYCRELNGPGNTLIREFVEEGGSYLGICAGAYYGCGAVEFEVGDPQLEVVGPRELSFWPGTARGAAYSGFDYATERGAVAAPLRFLSHFTHAQPCSDGKVDCTHSQSGVGGGEEAHVKHSFGSNEEAPSHDSQLDGLDLGRAEEATQTQPTTAGRTHDTVAGSAAPCSQATADQGRRVPHAHGHVTASVSQSMRARSGRRASLQPQHLRPLSELLAATPRDSQPGPSSYTHAEGPACHATPTSPHDATPPATAANRPSTEHARPGKRPRQGLQPAARQHMSGSSTGWDTCVDYCNGGPVFRGASSEPGQGGVANGDGETTVLALYSELGPDAVAAVRCRVGRGVAVLTGTHPEVCPSMLASALSMVQGAGSDDTDAYRRHVAALQAALQQSEPRRRALWHMLLSACCASFRPGGSGAAVAALTQQPVVVPGPEHKSAALSVVR